MSSLALKAVLSDYYGSVVFSVSYHDSTIGAIDFDLIPPEFDEVLVLSLLLRLLLTVCPDCCAGRGVPRQCLP